jgi:S-formylglutathione hydrolase FrmB
MRSGRSPTADARDRLQGDRHIREGDIVVTAVSGHYAIGRMTADRHTQEFLASEKTRAEALQQACRLAGQTHRVFLYGSTGTNDYLPVDCTQGSQWPGP